MIGTTLGHYRIDELLGVGGMGEVYRARDLNLDRDVALKILPATMAADPDRRRRFEREAKAVASLKHPNIVTIHSVEEVEGHSFLTMEMVEGGNLSTLIPKDGFGAEELLRIAVNLTDALTAAHDQGITHRDLKPANIMIDPGGQLKVLDFGLAKLRESLDPGSERTLAVDEATQEGRVLGTVAYMSPEQAEGKPVDARSDVFSLGVVLYEMATGDRPFKGDTNISTISAILREEPTPITELKKRLPRHLGRIVRRCLAKDRDRRYQTAHDLRNDLLALQEEIDSGEMDAFETIPEGPDHRTKRPWLWPVLAVALAALGVAAYHAVLPMFQGEEPAVGQPPQAMQVTRLTTTGNAYETAISPDGRYVAYVVRDNRREAVLIAQVATGSAVEIVPFSETHLADITFSPSGDHVYYLTADPNRDGGDLFSVPALGGTPRRVAEDVKAGLTFSPDGTRMAFVRANRDSSVLVIAEVDGRNEQVLAGWQYPRWIEYPVWSPDGTTLVTSELSIVDQFTYRLIAIDTETGAIEPLTEEPWIEMGEIAWLPDGSGLIVAGARTLQEQGRQLWEVSYPDADCRRITNDTNSYSGVKITADGSVLSAAVVDSDFDVYVMSPGDLETLDPLTTGNQVYNGFGLTWTAEDTIVYGAAASSGAVAGPEYGMFLHSVDLNAKVVLQLTDAWSAFPRARTGVPEFVYASVDSTGIHVWKMAVGDSPVQLTFGIFETVPDLSPDGERVVYFGGTGWEIFQVPLAGGEPVRLGSALGYAPLYSPDGTRIAYAFRDPEAQTWMNYVVPAEGGDTLAVLQVPSAEFEWAPDGEALTYISDQDGFDNIWRQPLDGGEPEQITFFVTPEEIEYHAWSPGGTRLALTRGSRTSDVVLVRNFR